MTERKFKIAVFYYTQSGQALTIVTKICEPLAAAGCELVYKEIIPETPYPFPWTAKEFFEVFPESRLGIACALKTINLQDVQDADLVMIAGQSWYLSLSVPLHSFFQCDKVKSYLKNRNIVFINGNRNMWMMTQKKTREYIREAGGHYVGFIELHDKAPNLISVLTIIRWLFYGKKEATRLLPAAGVSNHDIERANRFGQVIGEALFGQQIGKMQEKLVEKDAVTFIPYLYFIERNGYKLWGKWAHFVLKKGGYRDPARKRRLKMFSYYLFFVLYAVSPLGLLFHHITYPFRKNSFAKAKREMCYELV